MTRRISAGFALLCVLSGSGWVLDELAPGHLHGLLRMAVHDGVLAVVVGGLSLLNPDGVERPWRFWVKLAIAGVVMFAVPQTLIAAAGGHVSGMTELLIYLLVPAVVVFVVAQQTATIGSAESALRFLTPALAGWFGAVLMFPFDWPPSPDGRIWLVAMVGSAVLAGFAAVRLHIMLQGVGALRAAAVMFGATALAAAAFCWVDWGGIPGWNSSAAMLEVVRLVAVEAPIMLLMVWLLREMKPIRFSAHVLMVPLVMIVEGYLLERPSIDWTTALGVVLLAVGAVGLLRAESA